MTHHARNTNERAIHRRLNAEIFRKIFKDGLTADEANRAVAAENGFRVEPADNTNASAPSSAGAKHASELADLLAEASKGEVDRATALDWLLHDPHGRAMAQMHKQQMSKQQKEIPAMPDNTFSAVIKNHGVVAFSKAVADSGRCDGAVTEQEFTAAVTDYAKARALPGETPDAAFARVFTANDDVGLTLRKACAIIKNTTLMPIMPVSVGGDAATNVNDPEDALAQLQALAERMRASSPALSKAQAFAKVFQDPANAALAAAERRQNRPSA